MSTFGDAIRKYEVDGFELGGLVAGPKRAAYRVVVLPPSAFADTWKHRPGGPTKIGLRLVGEDVTEQTQSSASRLATELHPREDEPDLWVEAFNAELKYELLCQACCEPDDSSAPFFATTPNDTIRAAFTAHTVNRLWQEYELLQVTTSPLIVEASEVEIYVLGQMLSQVDPLEGIAEPNAKRIRRLITNLREEMFDAGALVDDGEAEAAE